MIKIGGVRIMRYNVFWGDNYYPLGGMKDECKEFEHLDTAIAFAEGVSHDPLTWAHVYDKETKRIYWDSEKED